MEISNKLHKELKINEEKAREILEVTIKIITEKEYSSEVINELKKIYKDNELVLAVYMLGSMTTKIRLGK